MNGWFAINRHLIDSARWFQEPFTRAQAWIDLIGLARHEDGYVRIRGIKIDLKRGQLAYSQVSLSKRWQWSRGKVIRYLNELEMDQDIEQQNNEVTTVITILKYNNWQPDSTTYETTDGQQTEQQTDSKRYTNNKGNKGNNEKERKEERAPSPNSSIKILDDPTTLQELQSKFPDADVVLEIEKIKDWLASRGRLQKDYVAFARNWIRKNNAYNRIHSRKVVSVK